MYCQVWDEISQGFYLSKTQLNKKLRCDSVHKQIMTTKCKLEDDEAFDGNEAIRDAVKKRKYLIQDVTGTLSDWELETDDNDGDVTGLF